MMLREFKVACAVVLYRPDADVLSNIGSYYNSVDLVIAVDNSEVVNTEIKEQILQRFPGIQYHALNQNLGIAAALNVGARLAQSDGCSWMLTMDQDSSFQPGEPAGMISRIPVAQAKFSQVGIISPYHVLHGAAVVQSTETYSEKNIVMTSGNLLNLQAYESVGSFKEDLFMDYVDYEYCLRLRKNGFKIIQDNAVRLTHSLGNFEVKKLFSQNIGVSNHNATRRYYMSRNSLYVGFKYRRTDKKFFLNMIKNIMLWDPLIILLFEKNKIDKLVSIYKGTYHFLINRYGKIR